MIKKKRNHKFARFFGF